MKRALAAIGALVLAIAGPVAGALAAPTPTSAADVATPEALDLTQPTKLGVFSPDDGVLTFQVIVPAADMIDEAGEPVVITDTLEPDLPLEVGDFQIFLTTVAEFTEGPWDSDQNLLGSAEYTVENPNNTARVITVLDPVAGADALYVMQYTFTTTPGSPPEPGDSVRNTAASSGGWEVSAHLVLVDDVEPGAPGGGDEGTSEEDDEGTDPGEEVTPEGEEGTGEEGDPGDQSGSVTVLKLVEGDVAGDVLADQQFKVGYCYTLEDGSIGDSVSSNIWFELTDGSSGTTPPLPAGLKITLFEVPPPPFEGGEWIGATFDGEGVKSGIASSDECTKVAAAAKAGAVASVEVPSPVLGQAQAAMVTLTNTAKASEVVPPPAPPRPDETPDRTGTFSLQSRLVGIEASAFDDGARFPVEARWRVGGKLQSKQFALPVSGALIPSALKLPVGTVVEIRELPDGPVAPGYASDGTQIEPASFVVKDGQNPTITVTNSFRELVGGFAVEKDLYGVDQSDFPDETTFEVTATITEPGGQPYKQTLKLPVSGAAVDGPENLLQGTTVSFEEKDAPTPDGHTFERATIQPQTLRVQDGQPTLVKVTNTYREQLGGFSLQAQLDGLRSSQLRSGATFDVVATWTLEEVQHEETFQLPATGTVVRGPQELPEGTVVTFSQLEAPTAKDHKWKGAEFEPISVRVADGENALVTVVNTYADNSGRTGAAGPIGLALLGLSILGGGAYWLIRRHAS